MNLVSHYISKNMAGRPYLNKI